MANGPTTKTHVSTDSEAGCSHVPMIPQFVTHFLPPTYTLPFSLSDYKVRSRLELQTLRLCDFRLWLGSVTGQDISDTCRAGDEGAMDLTLSPDLTVIIVRFPRCSLMCIMEREHMGLYI